MPPSLFRDPESTRSLGATNNLRHEKKSLEGECLLKVAAGDESRGNSTWIGSSVVRVLAVTFIGCCLGVFWLLRDCMPRNDWDAEALSTTISKSQLEKYDAPAPSATSSVLEVFQVYQPVLTSSGATDETILGDGSENTTSLAATSSGTPCQIILMQHTFAYSYGEPFVGMLSHLSTSP
jgi:hypothetical protein